MVKKMLRIRLPVWLKLTLICVIGLTLIAVPLMWLLGVIQGLICTLIVLALSWVVWGREVEAPELTMRESVWYDDEEEDNA